MPKIPAPYLLPDGREVRGRKAACAALGISPQRLHERTTVDAYGLHIVRPARPSGRPSAKEARP